MQLLMLASRYSLMPLKGELVRCLFRVILSTYSMYDWITVIAEAEVTAFIFIPTWFPFSTGVLCLREVFKPHKASRRARPQDSPSRRRRRASQPHELQRRQRDLVVHAPHVIVSRSSEHVPDTNGRLPRGLVETDRRLPRGLRSDTAALLHGRLRHPPCAWTSSKWWHSR